jgi:putative transposase
MCPRFVFLLTTRLAAWLRLSQREETWKTAEILILRHQLAVLQRRQPRRPTVNWADRALLATLLGVIPRAWRRGMLLLITPDTILRWHRDIVRRHWAVRSTSGKIGRPVTRRSIKALALRLARENTDYVEPGIMWSRAMLPFWWWCLCVGLSAGSRIRLHISSVLRGLRAIG